MQKELSPIAKAMFAGDSLRERACELEAELSDIYKKIEERDGKSVGKRSLKFKIERDAELTELLGIISELCNEYSERKIIIAWLEVKLLNEGNSIIAALREAPKSYEAYKTALRKWRKNNN